jgi:hypothetical protein
MLIGNVDLFGRRGQELVMVLYALSELRGIRTKEDVLRLIRQRRFYELRPEDKESYEGKREWKSDTLLCFARKDAVGAGFMFNHDEKNSWEITRSGLDALAGVVAYFHSQPIALRRCFMWRPEFKLIIDPSHTDISEDHVRRLTGRGTSFIEKALAMLSEIGRQKEQGPRGLTMR